MDYSRTPSAAAGAGSRTIGTVLVLVACVLSLYLWRVHNGELWPVSEARVKSIRIERTYTRRGYSSSNYRVLAKISYQCGGGAYTEEATYASTGYASEAEKIASDLKRQGSLLIRVDPGSPHTVMLEKVLQENRVISVPVALLMALLFLVGPVLIVAGLCAGAGSRS
ncbi:MAG TPA: hypothetical protein PL012_06450 [Candidatus Obscuribacter sp.]|nr:hypothetical protein [Candidatus Obscuribacter sp.]